MGKTALKWIAAAGTGGVYAALSYILAMVGIGLAEMDPAIHGIAVFGIAKLVGWATAKVPTTPAPPASHG